METNDEQKPPAPVGEASAADDLLAENQALKQMIRLRDAREVLTTALVERGARSPGLLFSYAVDDLQFDDDGNLENASAVVRKIEKAFPEQFEREGTQSINGGAGVSHKPTSLTRESLAKMRPSEIAALDWNEVRRVLSEK